MFPVGFKVLVRFFKRQKDNFSELFSGIFLLGIRQVSTTHLITAHDVFLCFFVSASGLLFSNRYRHFRQILARYGLRCQAKVNTCKTS